MTRRAAINTTATMPRSHIIDDRRHGARRSMPLLHASILLIAAQLATVALAGDVDAAAATTAGIAASFRQEVDRVLTFSEQVADGYAALARDTLARSGLTLDGDQFVVVVDRSPKVQAMLVLWLAGERGQLIGASPVSTGLPGRFDHFETPLGAFDHTPANPDFRAEGTRNENGIRGYGVKGMRVFDLGWQQARRGWGDGRLSTIRLQMHATDPDLLEARLGTPQSKGCIRIPRSLDTWLDVHGVLDADYDALPAADARRWVLRRDRLPVQGAGRYVVVVETPPVDPPIEASPSDPSSQESPQDDGVGATPACLARCEGKH